MKKKKNENNTSKIQLFQYRGCQKTGRRAFAEGREWHGNDPEPKYTLDKQLPLDWFNQSELRDATDIEALKFIFKEQKPFPENTIFYKKILQAFSEDDYTKALVRIILSLIQKAEENEIPTKTR